ncbi:hypothetical protein ICL81_06625 [Leucobacter sp. cx-328]|uniref:hypothetical protein n=1 Tax=unclassified Leucobacter TaxID=2621730 RepID=UPI00165E49C8|nr:MULTISPECIES: hypothetical protein [unclassified Leucobacter]MBC9944187.1 hypothetical protein [Leucobacter sp. cx-328]
MHPAEFIVTIAAASSVSFLIGCAVVFGIEAFLEGFGDWRQSRHQRKLARIEEDLDDAQEELRHTILELAEQLAVDRDEASRALTRAAYLTSGTIKRAD